MPFYLHKCYLNAYYPQRAEVQNTTVEYDKFVDMRLSKISPGYNTRLDPGTDRTTRRKGDLPHGTFLPHQTCRVKDSTGVSTLWETLACPRK